MTKGYIYFIRDEHDHVKIGKSYRPSIRMKTLQVGNADKLTVMGIYETDAPSLVERDYHKRYEYCHYRGEWFTLTPELLEHIKRMTARPLGDESEWTHLEPQYQLADGPNDKYSKEMPDHHSWDSTKSLYQVDEEYNPTESKELGGEKLPKGTSFSIMFIGAEPLAPVTKSEVSPETLKGWMKVSGSRQSIPVGYILPNYKCPETYDGVICNGTYKLTYDGNYRCRRCGLLREI